MVTCVLLLRRHADKMIKLTYSDVRNVATKKHVTIVSNVTTKKLIKTFLFVANSNVSSHSFSFHPIITHDCMHPVMFFLFYKVLIDKETELKEKFAKHEKIPKPDFW